MFLQVPDVRRRFVPTGLTLSDCLIPHLFVVCCVALSLLSVDPVTGRSNVDPAIEQSWIVSFFFFFTPYIPWVTQYPIPHAGTTPSKTLEQPHLKRWNNLQQNAGTTCTSYRKDAGTITKRSWNSVGSALEHPHSGSPSRWNKHDNRLWNKLTLEHPHSGTLLRWNTLTLEHPHSGTVLKTALEQS